MEEDIVTVCEREILEAKTENHKASIKRTLLDIEEAKRVLGKHQKHLEELRATKPEDYPMPTDPFGRPDVGVHRFCNDDGTITIHRNQI